MKRVPNTAVRHGVRAFTRPSPDELAAKFMSETAPPKIEFGTLNKSIIPTMHFQKSLLRLPIAKLEQTCANYLQSVRPLLSDEDFKITTQVVKAFQEQEGKELHAKLLAKDKLNKHTSYISADWFDMYLSARTPLPLNWNPFVAFRKDPVEDRNTQAFRTAAFINASIQWRTCLEQNTLAPEVFHLKPKITKAPWFQKMVALTPQAMASYVSIAAKGFPLDMSQFKSMFNTTRIPGFVKDTLKTAPKADHIVVFYKGHPFVINVAKNGQPLSVDQIAARLTKLLFDMPIEQNEYPIGALTAIDRSEWSQLRDELELDSHNKFLLDKIDSAAFVVCLDDESADFSSAEAVTAMGRQFLHGNPQKGNRWWDKSFSLLVSKNGYASCNFEHSWGDGVAVMRWANDVFHTASESRSPPKPEPATEEPEKLTFTLNDKLKKGIKNAIASFQHEVDRLDYNCSVYPDLGKQGLKKLKVSPDGFMQQAFQLGFKKLYNETRSTYESASTSAFKHGRTEAIRVATSESKEFCEAMLNDAVLPSKKHELFKAAVKKHGDLTKAALSGQGTDRHLFALRKIAEKSGLGVPAIFTDKGYQVLNENIISTSTLYNECLCLGGFAPVHPEGLGVGYCPTPNLLFLGVTSYSRNCEEYTNAVLEACDQMKWLLEKSK
eukprot:TRINITY_DN37597_c0_g1_i1.p1 TRINITY_DN37597_c0_g1~~TRINITY_DN37597_c0_g1_i1.p1  ORF type:complete len:663 (+),score=251.02 TRINITY_DN37597_c0_g1_i1:35-2023(+)